MSAPTQLWTPGRRDGQPGRDAPLPALTGTPGGAGIRRSRASARRTHQWPSRPGGAARPRLPAHRIEAAPCPTGPSRRPVALLVVMVVTFAVVCGLALLGQVGAGLSEVPRETSVVRIGAGETVWDVAERVAPGSDVRAVTARIRELNGMSGSEVAPGMPLRVPDGR